MKKKRKRKERKYSKEKKYYTYILIDSRNGKPFYIGKGSSNRMYCHVENALKGKIMYHNKKKHYKILSILKNGGKVLYKKFIKDVNEKTAFNFEKLLVKKYGKENLCNLTNGGDGGGIWFTEEVRRKMSIKAKGKIISKEMREKISFAMSGEKHPLFGKKFTEESKMKMSISTKKFFLTKEGEAMKEKIRLSNEQRSKFVFIYKENKLIKKYFSIKKLHKKHFFNIIPYSTFVQKCRKGFYHKGKFYKTKKTKEL